MRVQDAAQTDPLAQHGYVKGSELKLNPDQLDDSCGYLNPMDDEGARQSAYANEQAHRCAPNNGVRF